MKKSADKTVGSLFDKASKDNVKLSWDRLEIQEPQCGFGKLGQNWQ